MRRGEEYPVIDLCTDDEDSNDDTIKNHQVAVYVEQHVAMVDWETDSEDPSFDEEMEDSSVDEEREDSFASEMSSDFGDIFQYERDLSYDAFQCSRSLQSPRQSWMTRGSSALPVMTASAWRRETKVPMHGQWNLITVSIQITASRTTWKNISPTQPRNRARTTTTTPPSSKSLTAMQDPLP
jgi:hypothetical protein